MIELSGLHGLATVTIIVSFTALICKCLSNSQLSFYREIAQSLGGTYRYGWLFPSITLRYPEYTMHITVIPGSDCDWGNLSSPVSRITTQFITEDNNLPPFTLSSRCSLAILKQLFSGNEIVLGNSPAYQQFVLHGTEDHIDVYKKICSHELLDELRDLLRKDDHFILQSSTRGYVLTIEPQLCDEHRTRRTIQWMHHFMDDVSGLLPFRNRT